MICIGTSASTTNIKSEMLSVNFGLSQTFSNNNIHKMMEFSSKQGFKNLSQDFNPKQKFQLAIRVVLAVVRIKRLKLKQEPISVETAKTDPYKLKCIRQVIDGCAFRVYGHWVKKAEDQNRAALFENLPKSDLKQVYVNNINRSS